MEIIGRTRAIALPHLSDQVVQNLWQEWTDLESTEANYSSGIRVQGLGLRLYGLGFRVVGGFRV